LGFDPLYVANEGKCIVFVAADAAADCAAGDETPSLGTGAAMIGHVVADHRKCCTEDARWRQAGCGHAFRRTVAENLLTRQRIVHELRGGMMYQFDHILCATDFSQASLDAIRFASFAVQSGGSITLLYGMNTRKARWATMA